MHAERPDTSGGLLTDLMRLGPAPTMAREVAAQAVTLVIVVALVLIIQRPVLSIVLPVVFVVSAVIRFAVGRRRWRQRPDSDETFS